MSWEDVCSVFIVCVAGFGITSGVCGWLCRVVTERRAGMLTSTNTTSAEESPTLADAGGAGGS
jgi:hypothetical protein